MLPVPLIAAGFELLNTALSGDKEKDEKKIVEVLGNVSKIIPEKPFWKSKRFAITSITIVLLFLNRKLGLDLSIEEIAAIAGLVSAYVASKSWEQKD